MRGPSRASSSITAVRRLFSADWLGMRTEASTSSTIQDRFTGASLASTKRDTSRGVYFLSEEGMISGPTHGFIRSADGTFLSFEFPEAWAYAFIPGINNRGQLVGTSFHESFESQHAFIGKPVH